MTQLRLPNLRELRDLPLLPGLKRSPGAAADSVAPVLDLLRERRQEIGQQTIASVLGDRQSLMLQGFSLGALVLGAVAGISALVFLRHQVVKAQMGQLNQVEAQAEGLRQELGHRSKRLSTITEVNQQLSNALSSVRPTSALMSELQLRTPDGVQLLSAESADTNLVVRGLARDPLAFARINAMQLEMRRSPLLDPQSISLSKMERKDQDGTDSKAKTSSAIPIQFEISARLAQLPPIQMEEVLRQLGSTGMARRLALLQKEGLLR